MSYETCIYCYINTFSALKFNKEVTIFGLINIYVWFHFINLIFYNIC